MVQQSLDSQGLLLIDVSQTLRYITLLLMSDQLIAKTSTYEHKKLTTSMPPAGFEPTISAGERPHTRALDRRDLGDRLT